MVEGADVAEQMSAETSQFIAAEQRAAKLRQSSKTTLSILVPEELSDAVRARIEVGGVKVGEYGGLKHCLA
jgi:hypothetical protein